MADDVKLPEPPECYVTSGGRDLWSLEQLQAYAARAVAEAVAREREACAVLCEDISDEYQRREGRRFPELKTDAEYGAGECARAIRNRSNKA